MQKVDKYRYQLRENDIELIAEKHTLIDLARMLREANVEGTWSDLAFRIEWEFDVDGIRSECEDEDDIFWWWVNEDVDKVITVEDSKTGDVEVFDVESAEGLYSYLYYMYHHEE